MKGKIGIRPIVDPRDGARESVEGKALAMAQSAKELIERELCYSDGTPVVCVLSHGSIAGRADAARAEEEFRREGVIATLSVTPIFCYGTETFDFDPHTLKAVWGFNGTERPGAVYLACAMSGYAEYGLPAFSIYGKDVQDLGDDTIPADVKESILRFARCAVAVGEMRGGAYVSIGNVAMGIPGSRLDPKLLQEYFGMRPEWVDMVEVLRRLERGIYDADEYARAMRWVKQNIREGEDLCNPASHRHDRKALDRDWEISVKMALIFKDILFGNPVLAQIGYAEESMGRGAVCGGFQGQRQWTDFMPNADFAEYLLNTSFDWNGVRKPTVFATENDTLNGLSMLLQHLLTQQASIFADVRTYWSPEAIERISGIRLQGRAAQGFIHMNNSGAAALDGGGEMKRDGVPVMKRWWEVTEEDVRDTLRAVRFHPAKLEYFKGGGFSSHFVTRAEMPMTMMRLNLVYGRGPVLQVVEGYSLDLPASLSDAIENRTDPSWPTTYFAPRIEQGGLSAYEVMTKWGANHCCLTYGHIGADVLTLASMLRIPVSMHNVPSERIFRPHVWSAYGIRDEEGADAAACRAFGPLYR